MRKLGFIGSGRMAQALAGGIARSDSAAEIELHAADPSPAARKAFLACVPDGQVSDRNTVVCEHCDTIVLAIKPYQIESVLPELRPVCGDRLLVSILAGVPLARLEAGLSEARWIRVMPNTPCLVGRGVLAMSRGSSATQQDLDWVESWLAKVGIVEQVPERLIDAVTGLSGSGPAYVFSMIEAMSDGGVLVGLPRDQATRFAIATILGAGTLAERSGEHPALLREQVTSPGGTTAAGLFALDRAGFRAAVIDAVQSSARRASEIAKVEDVSPEPRDGQPTDPSSENQ